MDGKNKFSFPSRRKFLRKLTQFSSLKWSKFWNIYMTSSNQPFRISRLNSLCANTLTETWAYDLCSFGVCLLKVNSEQRTISDSLLYTLNDGSVHFLSSAYTRGICPQTDLHSASEQNWNVGACFYKFLPKPGH